MQKLQPGLFFYRLYNKKIDFPFDGQIELTYRCNLDCIHCYYKGAEDKNQELTTEEWKRIFDEIYQEGCLKLCLTGGDPLVRHDFLELYSYAKHKGFLVTLFTNGQALTPKLIDYLVTFPPFSIEITLNGITQKTYESITQVPDSFHRVMKTIRLLKQKKLPFILKSNCLKQNKYEIGRIKAFTEKLFDKLPRNKHHFKYDPMIYPRYNRNKIPCNYRLSFKEMEEIKKQDPDIWDGYQDSLKCKLPRLKRNREFLYQCNLCFQSFFIDPFGYLKFCDMTDKFSTNLKTNSFREGFYKVFPGLVNEKFKTNSKCRDCKLRPICNYCPAKAYVETGNEEGPVPYYCQLAKATAEEMARAKHSDNVARNT